MYYCYLKVKFKSQGIWKMFKSDSLIGKVRDRQTWWALGMESPAQG